jgi:hypothetical protein
MESEISELTDRLSELKVRYRGVKRLMDNKNIHLIKGNRQNRLKINWRGKSFWYHLPLRYDDVDVSNRVDEFIDKVLSGKIR